MARVTADLARLLAAQAGSRSQKWEDLRDWIDLETGSDLDCLQLDLLTDMVRDRLTPHTSCSYCDAPKGQHCFPGCHNTRRAALKRKQGEDA
jgi:hypothetical protein